MSDADGINIWCSTADAVRRLAEAGDKISQQRLTAYLGQNPEIGRRPSATDGRVTEIDFEALLAHRQANVRAADHRARRKGRRNTEADDLRLRERRAQAELREFHLAERRGELMARQEALRAAYAAGVALTQVLQRTRFERAEALRAGGGDVRAMAALLETQDAALQQALADALKALAAGAQRDNGDEPIDAAADSAGEGAPA